MFHKKSSQNISQHHLPFSAYFNQPAGVISSGRPPSLPGCFDYSNQASSPRGGSWDFFFQTSTSASFPSWSLNLNVNLYHYYRLMGAIIIILLPESSPKQFRLTENISQTVMMIVYNLRRLFCFCFLSYPPCGCFHQSPPHQTARWDRLWGVCFSSHQPQPACLDISSHNWNNSKLWKWRNTPRAIKR